MAQGNIDRAGVADRVQIIIGAAPTRAHPERRLRPRLIDADKENNSAYVERAIEPGRPGTVIVVDNAVRNGRIVEPGRASAAVRDMLEMMAPIRAWMSRPFRLSESKAGTASFAQWSPSPGRQQTRRRYPELPAPGRR